MKKFCGRSLEKSRDQIFQKNSIFLQKMLFSHRQYTYQMNRNCFAVRMQKKIVWSHPRKNFKLLISLNVWTEIRFGQKIRYQHGSSRQMICIDNMVLFLAQKFRTKFVFHAYTIIYLSRNFDKSKLSYNNRISFEAEFNANFELPYVKYTAFESERSCLLIRWIYSTLR